MSKQEDNTLESLIAGGFIGAALGAFLSKDKEEGAVIGALLGAAFSATLKASKEARNSNVPVFVEEDGKLYEINPSGEKRFIREIKKPSLNLPNQFKLK
jgi:hypothetical protein